ncbi:MAG: tRNA-binding protein, partial [Phyllobacteriaceae bacterium]|nr:tRNA-binding protein [Phyllobacteriaceae bacterium]
ARKPALKLRIDFGGAIGIKKSSAQITRHYTPEALIGRQVLAVVNFPPRQIGPLMSEVLTLGMPDETGEVVLVQPERHVPNGGKLF